MFGISEDLPATLYLRKKKQKVDCFRIFFCKISREPSVAHIDSKLLIMFYNPQYSNNVKN